MPKLTAEMIDLYMKGGRSYRRQQALAIGESYPAKKGWRERITGKVITQAQLNKFIKESSNTKAKDEYFKSKKKNKKTGKHNDLPDSLKEGFSLACWLIKDKGRDFITAVSIAANKHNCSKVELEKLVQIEIPETLNADLQDKAKLKGAIDHGVWLAENTNITLKNIIVKASEKFGYKVKSHIEKGIRDNLPENFFQKRAVMPVGAGENQRSRVLTDWSNKQHMKSIKTE